MIQKDISQAVILKKCIEYLKVQRKSHKSKYKNEDLRILFKALGEGHCSGLSGLYLLRKSRDEESQFLGELALISEWDDSKPEDLQKGDGYLSSIFEHFLSDMRFVHEESLRLSAYVKRQSDYDRIFKNLQQSTHSVSLVPEFDLTFHFNRKELVKALRFLVEHQEGKMVRIASPNHAMAVMWKDNKYWIYDPNSPLGEQSFEHLFNEEYPDEQTQLEPFIERALFGDNPPEYMPISINIFDWADEERLKSDTPEELIEGFLEEDRNLERTTANGDSLLMTCAKIGDLNTIKYIASKNKAKLLATNSEGQSLLMIAAANGHLDCVKWLMGQHLADHDNNNNSAFILAAGNGKLEVMKYLLKKGANINGANKDGLTPLMMAAKLDQLDAVQYLINNDASQDQISPSGSAIMQAARKGNFRIVQYLANNGARLDLRNDSNENLLMVAAESNNLELVKYLHDKSIFRLTATNNLLQTAASVAASLGNYNIAKWLIMKDKKVLKISDALGENLLMNTIIGMEMRKGVSIFKREPEASKEAKNEQYERGLKFIQWVIEQDPTLLNVQNQNKETALVDVLKRNNLKTAKFLLSFDKIDITIPDKSGKTAASILQEMPETVETQEIKKMMADLKPVEGKKSPLPPHTNPLPRGERGQA